MESEKPNFEVILQNIDILSTNEFKLQNSPFVYGGFLFFGILMLDNVFHFIEGFP